MRTIIISKDGRCYEYGVDHGIGADPFILGIDTDKKTALMHLSSCKVTVGIG